MQKKVKKNNKSSEYICNARTFSPAERVTVGTAAKSNRKSVEREAKSIPLTHTCFLCLTPN